MKKNILKFVLVILLIAVILSVWVNYIVEFETGGYHWWPPVAQAKAALLIIGGLFYMIMKI